MIEDLVKIHDKFSAEIKLRFNARKKQKINDFSVNTWIFVPSGLDINRHTYDKAHFYRDMKSNIRLVTPVYILRDIAEGDISPFNQLSGAFEKLASQPSRTHLAAYEYHIKMFLTILKSSLRDEIAHILKNFIRDDQVFLTEAYCRNVEAIAVRFRNLRRIINVPTVSPGMLNYYLFGDEFLSNLIEQHTFRLIKGLKEAQAGPKKGTFETLGRLIRDEIAYRKMSGYPVISKNNPRINRDLVFRFNLLKKYAESELFLSGRKKRDGVLVEQIYFSIAAGLSMIFATIVAFSFQQAYGNFTMPFFVALVISYMLKDRIKELGRYYFAHKLGRRYFDFKTHISLNNNYIGFMKEAMDFVPEAKVPEEVLKIRDRSAILEANNRFDTEKVILYRKLVRLDREKLDMCSQYPTAGMNEIIRFNVLNFMQKMDNPMVPLYLPDEGKGYEIVKAERIYYINLIMQFNHEGRTTYRRYRIHLNRKGIREVEMFQ
jgi:hypothetical protein